MILKVILASSTTKRFSLTAPSNCLKSFRRPRHSNLTYLKKLGKKTNNVSKSSQKNPSNPFCRISWKKMSQWNTPWNTVVISGRKGLVLILVKLLLLIWLWWPWGWRKFSTRKWETSWGCTRGLVTCSRISVWLMRISSQFLTSLHSPGNTLSS